VFPVKYERSFYIYCLEKGLNEKYPNRNNYLSAGHTATIEEMERIKREKWKPVNKQNEERKIDWS
jgi:hypothetical protein